MNKLLSDFLAQIGLADTPGVLYHLRWISMLIAWVMVVCGGMLVHPALAVLGVAAVPAWAAWLCHKSLEKSGESS